MFAGCDDGHQCGRCCRDIGCAIGGAIHGVSDSLRHVELALGERRGLPVALRAAPQTCVHRRAPSVPWQGTDTLCA
jgi:hypothetical protein